MDQIYLFNTKACKDRLEMRKEEAIVLANALVYASPSSDSSNARKKQLSWDRFIKSLDWRAVSNKQQKKSVSSLATSLGGMGVGVKK